MFGNLGFPEIMLLLVVVLLVFGAKRLPEMGAAMGTNSHTNFSALEGQTLDEIRSGSCVGATDFRADGLCQLSLRRRLVSQPSRFHTASRSNRSGQWTVNSLPEKSRDF